MIAEKTICATTTDAMTVDATTFDASTVDATKTKTSEKHAKTILQKSKRSNKDKYKGRFDKFKKRTTQENFPVQKKVSC